MECSVTAEKWKSGYVESLLEINKVLISMSMTN